MFDVVLLMAGSGFRTQLGYNKAFFMIGDHPMYWYSLQQFLSMEECDKIILVVRSEDQHLVSHLASDKIIITQGGLTRQDSVINGMEQTTQMIVLIHDAARPNIHQEDIIRVYQATMHHQAAVLAVPVLETIKEVEEGFSKRTLNRNNLWSMQTPQGVHRLHYLKCIKSAKLDGYQGFDDVEILEKYGGIKAKIVEGVASNIKATTPTDLKLLEWLMKEGR